MFDTFVKQARQAWDELNLYDHTHCVPGNADQDYRGKVLALRPTMLADAYKNPRDQLVLATGGFGASPNARGRKVYGQFLSDMELCQFDRQDFIGVIRDEHLPEWAREQAAELQKPEPFTIREEPSL